MRRIYQLSLLCLAAGVVNGCLPEEVVLTEDIPTAGVRFVNAVPDTFGFDFKPVDIVENSTFYGVTFRSTSQIFYKNARAGQRHFRIYLSPPDLNAPAEEQQAIASTIVQDIPTDLVAGHRYTFILWGFSRTGSTPGMTLTILDDDPADPGAQVAIRVVNAAAGLGPLDVFHYARGTTGTTCPGGGTVPATPTWAAVAALTVSPYVAAATGQICYRVTAAGTALFTDPVALIGAAATVDLDAIPGTTVAGSAISGFVFPRSVAGSRAPNITTPGSLFIWDRRPPRPPGI